MFRPFGTGAGSNTPFGTPQPAQTSSASSFAFGTPAFGAPPPSAAPSGAFGTSGGGLFGAPPQAASAVGFGAAGVPPRYSTTNDLENNVNITLHAITAMPAYQNRSLEEIRLDDYLAGRKSSSSTGPFGSIGGPVPGQGSAFGGGATTAAGTTGLFGSTAPTAGHPFGAAAPAPSTGTTAFGSQPAFGSSSGGGTSLFGAPPQAAPSGGAFGAFGAPQQSAGLFGSSQQQQPSSTGLFGGAPSAAAPGAAGFSAFGKPATSTTLGFGGGAGAFGAPAQQPAGGLFGGSAGSLSAFGAQQQQQQQQQQSFGAPQPTTTGAFGTGSAPSSFSTTAAPKPAAPTFGAFGTTVQPAAPSAFGQPAPAPSAGGGGLFSFGSAAAQPGAAPSTGGFTFGAGAQAAPSGGGGSLFGAAPAPGPSGLNLGITPSAVPSMGTSGGLGFNFGGAAPTAGGAATSFQQPTFSTGAAPTAAGTLPSGAGGFSFNVGAPVGGGTTTAVPSTTGFFGAAAAPLSSLPGGGTQSSFFQFGQPPPSSSAQTAAPLPLIPAESLSIKPPLPAALLTPKDSTISTTTTKSGVVAATPTTTRSPSRATPRASFRLSVPPQNLSNQTAATRAMSAQLGAAGFVLPRRVCAKKLVIEPLAAGSSRFAHPPPTPTPGEASGGAGLSRVSSQATIFATPLAERGLTATAAAAGSSEAVGGSGAGIIEGIEYGQKYMIPSEATLRKLPYAQLCCVRNFTVGEKGIGQVRFLHPVDLTKVAIGDIFDRIVVFEPRLVTLYPDDEFDEEEKPPAGTGLNVPAEVRLERCWCLGKADRQPIKDMGDARLQTHIERLKSMEDTQFIDYLPETGTWIFRVDHF